MSWNGTVHCSYCGQKGHNRLGCPERRKHALKNPESYEGRKWHREQARRQEQISNRVCSYCKKPGHNRRGCKPLKEDRQLIATRQKEYIDEFSLKLSSEGFGPGALIKVPHGTNENPWSKGIVAMLTKVRWCNVDFTLADYDVASSWQLRDKQILECRVHSLFGYPENDQDDYWRRDPVFNEVRSVTLSHLHHHLRAVISCEGDMGSDFGQAAELLSPKYGKYKKPETVPLDRLSGLFNLDPGPRDESFLKERLPFSDKAWSSIRAEEHDVATHHRQKWGE